MRLDPSDLTDTWAAAEAAGDAASLDALLTEDFRGIGPHGFVLDRTQWLARFQDDFSVTDLRISDVEVREHGDVAMLVGLQTQAATYRGHPSHGRFRLSMTLHRRDTQWRVLGVQLSGPLPDGAPA